MNCDNKSIGKYISILYRYQQCFMAKELKEYNLGTGQYIFLLTLLKKDGISQEELSKSSYIDKGTTARAIAKLEQEGYVLRKKDEEDKRTNRIYLTEKALEFKPVLFEILRKWVGILSSDLSKEEEAVAIKLLEKMGESAAKYMKENN